MVDLCEVERLVGYREKQASSKVYEGGGRIGRLYETSLQAIECVFARVSQSARVSPSKGREQKYHKKSL